MAMLWLASYPKSGNTWVRAFLANYYADAQSPLSLEDVRHSCYADAEIWLYRKALGRDVKSLPTDEALALRPKAHAVMAASSQGDVVVKTHSLFAFASGQQFITQHVTKGVVHIVRNPWDVAVSYADHFAKSPEDAAIDLKNPGLAIWPNPTQVAQPVGDWSQHGASWMQVKFRRLTVRYEDLVAKPHETFGQLVRFLDMEESEDRLDRAIRFSSFAELSAQEAEAGFAERSRHADKFFRKGGVGGWRETLPQAVVRKITKDYRKMARAFNYMTTDGRILV